MNSTLTQIEQLKTISNIISENLYVFLATYAHPEDTYKGIQGNDQEMYYGAICRQHLELLPAARRRTNVQLKTRIINSNKMEPL